MTTEVSTATRSASLILAALAAWLIYGVGLIAPLTPSEGLPSPLEFVVFVGVPISLLVIVTRLARSKTIRVLAVIQTGIILAITSWLLGLQTGIWRALFL
jgi:hypothetical protein